MATTTQEVAAARQRYVDTKGRAPKRLYLSSNKLMAVSRELSLRGWNVDPAFLKEVRRGLDMDNPVIVAEAFTMYRVTVFGMEIKVTPEIAVS